MSFDARINCQYKFGKKMRNAALNFKTTSDRRNFIKTSSLGAFALSTGLSSFSPSADAAQPASADKIVANSPYGVCAHIGAGEEWEQAPKNLLLMKKAGIVWVRADFSWIGVERSQGNWTFGHLDKIVDETNKLGLQLLPILDYDVPWATPAYKHLDSWLEYVTRTVERYKDRIQYWEVWNEPNLQGFWRDTPDGANYAILLKETYKTIKAIDPNLIVVYGGLAGVPADFFAKSLDAGAGDSFDVVNIHPYRGGISTRQRLDQFADDIDAFRRELKKRNLPDRPIWITEMGWATPPIFGESNRRVVSAALQKLFPNEDPKVAFFYDLRYDPAQSRAQNDFLNYLPEKYASNANLTTFLDADQLSNLSLDVADVLVMPPSEGFPMEYFEPVAEFVKSGGALILLGGVPLYYETILDKKTKRFKQGEFNPKFAQCLDTLRISWFAWWTRENVPENVPTVVAPESAENMPGFYPVHQSNRFFDGAKLKEGDKFIPLFNGKNETFSAASACIYDFNSDYKGAVVINSIRDDDGNETNRSTVANQAVFLSQAYLLAFANGIERYFWYEFHAPERDQRDPEHHFGIVGQKLAPKPGYFAYKALTKARPACSEGADLTVVNDCCVVSWKRPDGQNGWALWSLGAECNVDVKIVGEVSQAFDYLGNDVEKPTKKGKLNLKSGVLYLIGPETVAIK